MIVTIAQLTAAGLTVDANEDGAVVTLPDNSTVRVAVIDGQMTLHPARSSGQRRIVALLA